MNIIDFLIGFFLMNAMPHFVLGIYKGRILSLFGFGNTQNILYSAFNFVVAMSLFIYQYGMAGFGEHGMFVGALVILIMYYLTASFLYKLWHEKHEPNS